jgi:hypothetical protein
MAITPKQLLDTAVGVGKTVVTRGVELAEKRLRGDERPRPTDVRPSTPGTPAAKTTPSTTTRPRPTTGEPSTVGAVKPGKPGGPKSATAPNPKPATKATAAKKPKRTDPAATTPDEVADVMKKDG